MKVFISHSNHDKKFVRALKEDLKENGIDVWLDEDQLDLGDSLIEKLEVALLESSHFVIVLSPYSINSDWVKFEMERAFKQIESSLLNKIIPIKYQHCEIPKALQKLIYADLANETVQVKDNKVIFISDGYGVFLQKLVRSIRNSEKVLTPAEKKSIKSSISNEELEIKRKLDQTVKANYRLIGYKDSSAIKSYEAFIRANTSIQELKNRREIRPVLLPPLLKTLFKDIKIGEKLIFTDDFIYETYGHFAGFRKDDLSITLDPRSRKVIGVISGKFYKVEIDIKKRKISFMEIIGSP